MPEPSPNMSRVLEAVERIEVRLNSIVAFIEGEKPSGDDGAKVRLDRHSRDIADHSERLDRIESRLVATLWSLVCTGALTLFGVLSWMILKIIGQTP